jgi:hypothetical protein
MAKKTIRRSRQRKTRRRYKGGAFMQAIGEGIGQGIKQGIKQTPKALMTSIRSKGSSYLLPSGSIANYAGNNIQNIIQGHHQELGAHVGKSLQNIKTSLTTNSNKSKSYSQKTYIDPKKYSFMTSISPTITSSLRKQQSVFNNKFSMPRKNLPLYSSKFNSTPQLLE